MTDREVIAAFKIEQAKEDAKNAAFMKQAMEIGIIDEDFFEAYESLPMGKLIYHDVVVREPGKPPKVVVAAGPTVREAKQRALQGTLPGTSAKAYPRHRN